MEGWIFTDIKAAEAAEQKVNENFLFPKESTTQKMVSAIPCDDYFFILYNKDFEKYLGSPTTLTTKKLINE